MSVRSFGPFKSSFARTIYGPLLRLLWSATNLPLSTAQFPVGFFSQKPPHPFRISLQSNTAADGAALKNAICAFLEAGSIEIVCLLKAVLLADNRPRPLSNFLLSFEARDLELLEKLSGQWTSQLAAC